MSFASFQRGNYSSDACKSSDDSRLPQNRAMELKGKAPGEREKALKEKVDAGLPEEKKAACGQYTLDSVSGSATAGDSENMPKFDNLPRSQGALLASVCYSLAAATPKQ